MEHIANKKFPRFNAEKAPWSIGLTNTPHILYSSNGIVGEVVTLEEAFRQMEPNQTLLLINDESYFIKGPEDPIVSEFIKRETIHDGIYIITFINET